MARIDPTPRNRTARELPVLRIEIEHAGGTTVLDPNGLIVAVIRGDHRGWAPLPGAASTLSGEPAVIYRSADLEIPLAIDELDRLLRHDLRPDEFFALMRRHGDAFEWHDDFYDHETGAAMQPHG